MPASSSLRLLALHGLRLKGIAEAATVAATMGADPDDMAGELERLAAGDLATYRYGRIPGYQLTDEGRAMGQELLADELDATGTRPAIEAAYADFRTVNGGLLVVCTAWQLREVGGQRTVNDHSDPTYDDGVRRRLAALHDEVEPVLAALGGALARFAGHQQRLRFALDRVLDRDDDYFTRPMFPSYHSSWFELHEDLLATLGTDRSTERRRATAPATERSL